MAVVFVAVGSNLGDRKENISQAIKLIKEKKIRILKRSTLIETDPIGGPPQGRFLNGVIKVQTMLPPQALLNIFKKIEKKLRRATTVKNGPRTIDLDILLYDNIEVKTSRLTIPHPRMFDRDFVMRPLYEIAPDLRESGLGTCGLPKIDRSLRVPSPNPRVPKGKK